jgi:hypothetical protein
VSVLTPAESGAAFVPIVAAVLPFLLSVVVMMVTVVGSVADFEWSSKLLIHQSVSLVAQSFRVMALCLCCLPSALFLLMPQNELSPAILMPATEKKLHALLFRSDHQMQHGIAAKRDPSLSSGPSGPTASAVVTVQGTSPLEHAPSTYVCYTLCPAVSWSQEHRLGRQKGENGISVD